MSWERAFLVERRMQRPSGESVPGLRNSMSSEEKPAKPQTDLAGTDQSTDAVAQLC